MATKTPKESDWKSQYELLIGQLTGVRDWDEEKQRNHPRFDFKNYARTLIIQIHDDVASLCDISVSGLSFYSSVYYNKNDELLLRFDDRFDCYVQVASVSLDSKYSKSNIIYRFGAQFLEETDGYRCTVSALRYMLEILKSND